MLQLYQFGYSVCSQKVRITLNEKGLDWESINVDLFKLEQYKPDYLKLNPKGVVPTLVHDGKPVIESTLICEYLDETFPDPPLMPPDPWGRARMRVWSKIVDEGLHDGVTEISFSAMFRERMKEMSEETRQTRFRNVGDPRRRDRFVSIFADGVESPYMLHAIYAYEKALTLLDDQLADSGGPWVLGAQPTLADINLMPYAARLDYLNLLDVWTVDRPHVRDWWDHARQWPSYKKGLDDLTDDKQRQEMKEHGSAIRDAMTRRRAELLKGI